MLKNGKRKKLWDEESEKKVISHDKYLYSLLYMNVNISSSFTIFWDYTTSQGTPSKLVRIIWKHK